MPNEPAGQIVQTSLSRYLPKSQAIFTHIELPAALFLPSEHGRQSSIESWNKDEVPASSKNLPTTHNEHTVDDTIGVYLPDGQIRQSDSRSCAAAAVPRSDKYLPRTQDVHEDEDSDEYLPASQIVQ